MVAGHIVEEAVVRIMAVFPWVIDRITVVSSAIHIAEEATGPFP